MSAHPSLSTVSVCGGGGQCLSVCTPLTVHCVCLWRWWAVSECLHTPSLSTVSVCGGGGVGGGGGLSVCTPPHCPLCLFVVVVMWGGGGESECLYTPSLSTQWWCLPTSLAVCFVSSSPVLFPGGQSWRACVAIPSQCRLVHSGQVTLPPSPPLLIL